MIGIYGIRQNGNIVYVGSSVRIDVRYRQHVYRLRVGNHHSPYLQNAWNKYGEKVFDMIILEETTQQDLLTREQFYIDYYKPKYNVALVAGSRLGVKQSLETIEKVRKVHLGRKNTEETKAKMSAAALGNKNNLGNTKSQEAKDKMKATNAERKAAGIKRQRKPMSEETKEKLSLAQAGKPRIYAMKPRSEETKRKIREAQKGIPRPYASKPRSEETKRKISETSKLNHARKVGR